SITDLLKPMKQHLQQLKDSRTLINCNDTILKSERERTQHILRGREVELRTQHILMLAFNVLQTLT
ncbi:hypothetical protein ACJX0J_017846, partial [Zea mays]